MKHFLLPALLAVAVVSCHQSTSENSSLPNEKLPAETSVAIPESKVSKDSVVLPPFTVNLELSDRAEQKLKEANESVIVSVSYSGIPMDTTLEQYKQWGQIVVVNAEKELTTTRSVTFSDVKITKAAYDSLRDKDVEVLVNVYSGRRSSPNNVLSCDIIQDQISKVSKQHNVLRGKLIEE